jgi:hypothetical protein
VRGPRQDAAYTTLLTEAARAGGLADAAWIGYVNGRHECAHHAEDSVAVSQAASIPPDPEALCTLALSDFFAGCFDRSRARLEEATVAARGIDDPYEIAAALTGTCMAHAILGELTPLLPPAKRP